MPPIYSPLGSFRVYQIQFDGKYYYGKQIQCHVNYLYKIENIDLSGTQTLDLVNDKISGNLIFHIQYDDDLIRRLQVRELFGLGLSIDI